ncbi:hypothetical protein DRO26_03300, partial [Candidatus Bathyarchaeota archaeon]
MIIRKLTLKNIRSHMDSVVEFEEGFNCVVGGVGVGKTSILLSLHFVLFGEPLHRSYEYLLRENKNRGQVTVEFEHGGKTYRLTRALKRERNRIVQDTNELRLWENEKILAWGKLAAVQEQLQSIIGMDKKMFEEFVWIQQEKLKEILNMTPSERQRILDELFGFSSFQKAWERLLPYQRHYQAIKDTLERDPDVVGINDLKNQYEELASDLIKLQVEVETLQLEAEEAEKAFKEAEEKLRSLETLEKRINELKEEKSSISARLNENQGYIDNLKTLVTKKEKELNRVREFLEQLKTEKQKILTQFSKKNLSEIQTAIEKMDVKLTELRNKTAELRTNVEKLEETVLILEGESVCPTCQREIEPSYKEKLTSRLQFEKIKAEQEMIRLKVEMEGLETEYKEILNAKNRIEVLNAQINETQKSVREKEEEITNLNKEVSEREKLQKDLTVKFGKIEEEISKFKIEGVEKARKIREEKLLTYRKILDTIDHYKKLIEEKNTSLTLLEKRISNAEQKVIQKDTVESIVKIIGGLRIAYKEIIPRLRKTYIEGLREAIQSVLDSLTVEAEKSFYVEVDEEYTPNLVGDTGFKREAGFLSGGERTWLALAYRVGLGQLIMEAKTGQNLELLILDEPTEALGTEDKSIETLASAISNLKAVRQIITVTHSEELAKEASTRILVVKKEG